MEKKIEKGEFISQVETFARMMSEMTSEKDGVKRGLIILASESVESEDGTKQIVAVMGHGGKVVESIAALALQEKGNELYSEIENKKEYEFLRGNKKLESIFEEHLK